MKKQKNTKSNFLNMSIQKQNESQSVKFYVNKETGTVVCRLYDRWFNTYHIGKAQCNDGDKFNEKTGRAIAFNRARKKELEFNLEMIEQNRKDLNAEYNKINAILDKRAHLSIIYLTGVCDELAELTK